MNEDLAKMIRGVDEAMKAEIDGYHFYRMAAQSTADAHGQRTFQLLADEELQHARFLKAQYQSLNETGRVDTNVQLGPQATFGEMSPIFSAELKNRIKEAHYEMSALSIGMQLELSAVQFYNGQADSASSPDVQAFFRELAAWEKGHYEALSRQQEALKEDYWNAGGFSPF